jgi:hypothetical protein
MIPAPRQEALTMLPDLVTLNQKFNGVPIAGNEQINSPSSLYTFLPEFRTW